MKKIYIAPQVSAVKVTVKAIIAGSLDGIDVNTSGTSVDMGDAWGRQHNDWDIWGNGSSDEYYEDEAY